MPDPTPTTPAAATPPAQPSAPLDTAQLFNIKYKGKDIPLRLQPNELTAYLQKGYDYESRRTEMEQKMQALTSERESEKKQLETMRLFQQRMSNDPAFADVVDRMWKGELTPAQVRSTMDGSAIAQELPADQQRHSRTSRVEQEMEEKIARLEGRLTQLDDSLGRDARRTKTVAALQGDDFFRHRPKAQEEAADQIDRLVTTEGMTIDAAKVLVRTRFQDLLDETATAERNRLAENKQEFRDSRGGTPVLTAFKPNIDPKMSKDDKLKAGSASLLGFLRAANGKLKEGP